MGVASVMSSHRIGMGAAQSLAGLEVGGIVGLSRVRLDREGLLFLVVGGVLVGRGLFFDLVDKGRHDS